MGANAKNNTDGEANAAPEGAQAGAVDEEQSTQAAPASPVVAPAAEQPHVDKDGHLVAVGASVTCFAHKHKSKYHERQGKVLKLNSKCAVVEMSTGPVKGEKHKFPYTMIQICSIEPPQKRPCPDVGEAVPAAAPAAAPAAPHAAAPAQPERRAAAASTDATQTCLSLFGNLSHFG